MKTLKELKELKTEKEKEVETISADPYALSDEELEQVTGGIVKESNEKVQ